MAANITGATPAHPGQGAGPFVLRPLLDDVPLSEDGTKTDIKINCVDYLGKLVAPSASSRQSL